MGDNRVLSSKAVLRTEGAFRMGEVESLGANKTERPSLAPMSTAHSVSRLSWRKKKKTGGEKFPLIHFYVSYEYK